MKKNTPTALSHIFDFDMHDPTLHCRCRKSNAYYRGVAAKHVSLLPLLSPSSHLDQVNMQVRLEVK